MAVIETWTEELEKELKKILEEVDKCLSGIEDLRREKADNSGKRKDLSEKRKDEWDERLSTVFNRGFWDGYYQGQLMGEWNKNYGSNATERKVYIGKGTKY